MGDASRDVRDQKKRNSDVCSGDSRQLLDQWMPQPMWEMIDSVQRQQTADQNGAYFDGPGYCYEVSQESQLLFCEAHDHLCIGIDRATAR